MAESRVHTPRQRERVKEELRAEVLEAGFDRVGFTDTSILKKDRDYLAKRGPGPFEPTDLPPRTDPQSWLPNARTVVCVALSYHHSDPPKPDGPRGRLSKYCRGYDYHDLMLGRLQSISDSWNKRFEVKSECFVDTGPPLERPFAEKAGLGRVGKNTNLIIPRLGSWVFLGILVTELEIDPDPPAAYSICGSCRLCLDACPTQCLTEWELDSENCLGYLNQKFDDIPNHHREPMSDWLFGCDICQDVCPHNTKSAIALHPEFAPLQEPGAYPDLKKLVHMTDQQFEQWFRPTAADWRGPEALRRNALVALGNSEEEEAVDVLLGTNFTGILEDHADWAKQQLARRFTHRKKELLRS